MLSSTLWAPASPSVSCATSLPSAGYDCKGDIKGNKTYIIRCIRESQCARLSAQLLHTPSHFSGYLVSACLLQCDISHNGNRLGSSESGFQCIIAAYRAQYDTSYDVRDRARLVNALLFSDTASHLKDCAADIFLSSKPAPKFADAAGMHGHQVAHWRFDNFQVVGSHCGVALFEVRANGDNRVNKAADARYCCALAAGRDAHALGSLSNVLGTELPGYLAMPAFPEVAPDPKPRQVEVID